MENVVLKRIYDDFRDAKNILNKSSEISLATTLDDVARKTLIVSCASYFEASLTKCVLDFCIHSAGHNKLIPSLIESKAIKRQYHTWFSWESNNANTFFAMFGVDFKSHMASRIKKDPDLELQISAFMELGRERNKLVHGDYSSYIVEKTSEEIFEMYELATAFVAGVPSDFKACVDALAAA